MISFDRVVRILVCHVVGVWQQLIEDPQVGRRPVSGHLSQSPSLFEHLSKKLTGSWQVPLLRGEDVDDLPELVDRPIQIDLRTRHLDGVSSTNHRLPAACRDGRAASTHQHSLPEPATANATVPYRVQQRQPGPYVARYAEAVGLKTSDTSAQNLRARSRCAPIAASATLN
jgi:hypothetical protein